MDLPTSSVNILIDCFTFYNEIDLLKYRLHLLNPVVDYFILSEATHTYTGNSKSLFFQDEKTNEWLSPYLHKIIHIVVDDMPFQEKGAGSPWTNERFQRDVIVRGFSRIPGLDKNNLFLLSDLDEIPDPQFLYKVKSGEIEVGLDKPSSLMMDMYYYNLNTKHRDMWRQSKLFRYSVFEMLGKTLSEIRESYGENTTSRAGWHLSYFGDNRFIQNKLENFSHQEYNSKQYTDLNIIQERIQKGVDLFGRHYVPMYFVETKDNPYLPPDYEIYLSRFLRKTE